jgi:LmbE family N-acetylglucosaminyl deacetylase
MRRYPICLLIPAVLFLPHLTLAKDMPAIPKFTRGDRVLVMAPHPDDETLGTGGLIQRALSSGAKVRVACYTNGDHNQPAFMVYEKRLTFRTGEFLHMGEVRRKETVAAMTSLGLGSQDLVFMGYPDSGTMAILTKYWGKTKPFRSLMTRISKVAYTRVLSPNAPYVGESILKDIETVIRDFQPTKIFVSHPGDTNADHQSLYVFTRIALWELADKIRQPQVFPYLIHVIGWPKPRGHHLDLALSPPESFTDVSWQELSLTEQEAKTKQKLVSFYESEIEYNPPYLYTFARKNELFGDYPPIQLKANKAKELSWQDVIAAKDNTKGRNNKAKGNRRQDTFYGLAFARQDNNLFIRLKLKRKLDKNLGISIFLLGYSKKVDFSRMPKINVTIGLLGKRIKDKKNVLFVKDASLKFEGKALILKLPISCLGNPEYIFSKVKTAKFPRDASAWRIIKLE